MNKNFGPLNREQPPFAEMEVNGINLTHYMDSIDLPEGEARTKCLDHLEQGVASNLMDDFILGGCTFPGSDEEQIIRTALTCPGQSALRKTCRLRLIQVDASGDIIK